MKELLRRGYIKLQQQSWTGLLTSVPKFEIAHYKHVVYSCSSTERLCIVLDLVAMNYSTYALCSKWWNQFIISIKQTQIEYFKINVTKVCIRYIELHKISICYKYKQNSLYSTMQRKEGPAKRVYTF